MTKIEVKWEKYDVKNEEILALIRTWRSVSSKEKLAVEDLLIKRLSFLIRTRIKRYSGSSFYGDLLQEGKLSLIKALNDFDATRCPNFFQFAIWHILTGIKNFMNWRKRQYREAASAYFFKTCTDIVTPHEQYEKTQSYQILLEAIGRLPTMDKNVIIRRFGMNGDDPQTFQQIGNVFSLSRQRIEQIQSRAISRLKEDKQIKELCG